jgi:hypothetical protein
MAALPRARNDKDAYLLTEIIKRCLVELYECAVSPEPECSESAQALIRDFIVDFTEHVDVSKLSLGLRRGIYAREEVAK